MCHAHTVRHCSSQRLQLTSAYTYRNWTTTHMLLLSSPSAAGSGQPFTSWWTLEQAQQSLALAPSPTLPPCHLKWFCFFPALKADSLERVWVVSLGSPGGRRAMFAPGPYFFKGSFSRPRGKKLGLHRPKYFLYTYWGRRARALLKMTGVKEPAGGLNGPAGMPFCTARSHCQWVRMST